MYKAEEKERILKKVLEAYSMYQGVHFLLMGFLIVEIQKRLLPTCSDPRCAVQIRRSDPVHQLLHHFAGQFEAERFHFFSD